MNRNTLQGVGAFALGLACYAGPARAAPINLSGAPVVVSSTENGTYVGPNAFDNNNGSRWSSGRSDPQYIYVDLGQRYDLNQVTIDWEAAHGTAYKLYTFDGTTAPSTATALASWTEVASITGRSGVTGSAGAVDDTFNFVAGTFAANNGTATASSVTADPETARFLMLHGTARATQYGYSTYEIKVDGTAVPEPGASSLAGLAGAALLGRRRRRRRP